MAVITLGPENAGYIAELVIGQRSFDLNETSAVTGDTAVRVYAPPRWTVSLRVLDAMPRRISEQWSSILLRLNGRRNHFALWDVNNPVPRGTARGTLSCGAASQGATTISVSGGTPGDTLLLGDWLQIGSGVGSLAVKVVDPIVTLSGGGTGTVTVTPPLRKAVSGGTTITLEQPLIHFRSLTGNVQWRAMPGGTDAGGQTFDGVEDWNP